MAADEIVERLGHFVALGVESGAMVLIAVGAVRALVNTAQYAFKGRGGHLPEIRVIWLGFAGWLILALEFTVASDIVRTAISPTWVSIGHLAAVAIIRIVLNYFLAKDIEDFGHARQLAQRAAASDGT